MLLALFLRYPWLLCTALDDANFLSNSSIRRPGGFVTECDPDTNCWNEANVI